MRTSNIDLVRDRPSTSLSMVRDTRSCYDLWKSQLHTTYCQLEVQFRHWSDSHLMRSPSRHCQEQGSYRRLIHVRMRTRLCNDSTTSASIGSATKHRHSHCHREQKELYLTFSIRRRENNERYNKLRLRSIQDDCLHLRV